MKKWTKLAIPVAAVAALVAWYVFRPERLVVNAVLTKDYQPHKAARRRSLSNPDGSTAFCTRRKVPQPSSRWEMALVFSA